MDEIIPWDEWAEFVRPYYPDGRRGRPTKGIEKMLRMYLLQVWFNLSDEGVEDLQASPMYKTSLFPLVFKPNPCYNKTTIN